MPSSELKEKVGGLPYLITFQISGNSRHKFGISLLRGEHCGGDTACGVENQRARWGVVPTSKRCPQLNSLSDVSVTKYSKC